MIPLTPLSFGPWEPDKGPLDPTVIDTVVNMLPLANGWGPMPSLTSTIGTIAFAVDFAGSWFARASDGSFRIFYATRTRLYIYNPATELWDDISGPAAPYNCPSSDFWSAVQFGTRLILTNLEDPPQYIDIDSGSAFANLPGSPPQAKFVWTAGDFVVLGYLKVGANEFPQDIQWSGINDSGSWTASRQTGSDRQTLPDGGEIMGGFSFPTGARIVQRYARRAMYFGGQFIFEIKLIDPTKGAVFPLGIVQINADDYIFLADDGWYRGDGNVAIGAERVDATFLNDIDLTAALPIQGALDPFNKAAWFTYVGSDAAHKVIGYDWQLDRWFQSDMQLLGMVSSITPGYTLEALDNRPEFGGPGAPSIDTANAPSLDSRVWKGGSPFFGAVDEGGNLSLLAGVPHRATIETNTLQLTEGRTFVSGAKIVGDLATTTLIQVGTAVLPDDTVTFGAAMTRSSRTGLFPLRADGFFHRLRLNYAGSGATFTHLHGLSVEAQPSGGA